MALERAVFDKEAGTQILLLTEKEKAFYMDYYGTAAERFHLMPPGISQACLPPEDADEIRARKREELGIEPEKTVLLMVCTNFKIKGVARAIRALAALPPEVSRNAVLLVVGKDNPRQYSRLAGRMKVLDQVRFIGARDDVPHLLMATDFLIHPCSSQSITHPCSS